MDFLNDFTRILGIMCIIFGIGERWKSHLQQKRINAILEIIPKAKDEELDKSFNKLNNSLYLLISVGIMIIGLSFIPTIFKR